MKISGFTIARNAVKFQYPLVESIRSVLPLCDEMIVNVGESEDDTLGLVESIGDGKIKILRTRWDMSLGKEVLSRQTNLALEACRGDWAVYLQSDEVLHENDLPALRGCMKRCLGDPGVDALRFRWLHFYGSYYRYRIDRGWYQKQDRIIRNNGQVESFGDAYGFRRKDGRPLGRKNTGCLLYHYGWVHSEDIMAQRRTNAKEIGYAALSPQDDPTRYSFGDLNRFPAYFGSHPKVMRERVLSHALSRADSQEINRTFWWHPMKILKVRYKTFKRCKTSLT